MSSESFFISKTGREDPLLELQTLYNSDPRQTQCRFPARWNWLRQTLPRPLWRSSWPSTESISCPEYQAWKKGLDAQGVSMIFSTAYSNNPASLFGHSLLRIKSHRSSELLDYGVNYAAEIPPGASTLGYVFQGISGGYKGRFSIGPYYLKVNEYNHSESRDIWEYDLRLSPSELNRLVDHLWELQIQAELDYFFLDYNCSYQLLSLLEVAKPDWNLLERFNSYVLPADTIKTLVHTPGAVGAIHFRPSNRKKMHQLRDALSPEQEKTWRSLMKGSLDPQEVHDLLVLDAAIQTWDFRKFREAENFSKNQQARYLSILKRRSEIRTESSARILPALSEDTRPDLSHETHRIQLGGGRSLNDHAMISFGWRPGLHDLLDSDLGFQPDTQVEALGLQMQYEPNGSRLRLRELKLAELTSFHSWDPWDPQLSWQTGLRIDTVPDFRDTWTRRARLDAGFGISRNHLYALIQGHLEGSSSFLPKLRGGPGVQVGTVLNFTPVWKIFFSATAEWQSNRFQFSKPTPLFQLQSAYTIQRNFQIRASGLFLPLQALGLGQRTEFQLQVSKDY